MEITRNPSKFAGLFILSFCELLDRFSYYGLRAIIILFAVDETGLGLDNADVLSYYGTLTVAVYFMPLPLGIIVDLLLKQVRAAEIGGVIATVGYFTISLLEPIYVVLGLVLVVIGVSLMKPSLTVLVGRLYHKKDHTAAPGSRPGRLLPLHPALPPGNPGR